MKPLLVAVTGLLR